MLAFAVLGLIAAFVLTCCTVVRVRMVLYFTCGILMFMAVITFCMLIVFGAFLPNVSQACGLVDRRMANGYGLVNVLNNLQFNSTAALYTMCSATSGTGDIVNQLNS